MSRSKRSRARATDPAERARRPEPSPSPPAVAAEEREEPPAIPAAPPRRREELEPYLAAFTNYETQRALPSDRRLLGPRRCRALLDRAGLIPAAESTAAAGRAGARAPHRWRPRVIQVAGSKGKGSTVLWMEALLARREEGSIAYLSPHLERLEERIRRGGAPIHPTALLDALARLHPAIRALSDEDPGLRPTFFDLFTAAAVAAAESIRAPWLLLEVGLGGPLDSTTAVPHQVGVLATIDLEHREQLGGTLEAIAAEKAAIARPGAPFVIAADDGQDARALESAERVATARGALVRRVAIDPRVPAELGAPQRANLSLALAALESAGAAPFSPREVAAAAERIELPGRLELLPGPPPLLLDGAHTIRSVERFAERFREFRAGRPAALLVGAMADKEWREILAPLLAERDVAWIATAVPGPRGASAEEISAYLRERGRPAIALPLDEAVAALRRHSPRALAVTGSFRLAGEVRRRWR